MNGDLFSSLCHSYMYSPNLIQLLDTQVYFAGIVCLRSCIYQELMRSDCLLGGTEFFIFPPLGIN